jgi:uncharacterized iron-regulated membrane protein
VNKKKSITRKIIGWLHRWLGLTSGLVVFIVAITGCLYAFQAEIRQATQPFRYVVPEARSFMPPSKLTTMTENLLPGKHIHAVLYGKQDEAAQVILFNFEPDYYYYVLFVNPYTGEVLRTKNMERDFFQIVLDGHFYLWLPPTIGQPLIASATLVFTVLLITGLVLWWPRSKAATPQRFKIKWSARWRRKNYDLHNVLGFYASVLAIVLALTGLVWGFQWFAQFYYAAAGGEKSLVYYDPVSLPPDEASLPAIDRVWYKMAAEYPQAEMIEVHIPLADTLAVAANANPDASTYWKLDFRYFDQRTLAELPVDHVHGRYHEASTADKLMRMNYDIHTGAVLGFAGKLLAFCVSLVVASLPVTGFMIWWGRR